MRRFLAPLLLLLVALFHQSTSVDAARAGMSAFRSNSHINAITGGARFRTLDAVSQQFGCYGRYCGLEAACVADGIDLSPETRGAPIDKFDSACFLHDICYTCANTVAGDIETCCPDPSMIGLDKAHCDRVFLERLKNDDVCADNGDSNLPDRAKCELTRVAAVAAFEIILAGRTWDDDLTGTGTPSATNSPNATCDAFSCPYVVSNSCFQVCGDDGCGGQCSEAGAEAACPGDHTCDPYAHACFRTSTIDGGDGGGDGGDGTLTPGNAASASSSLHVAAAAATTFALAALMRT